jgi:hypothetical protein
MTRWWARQGVNVLTLPTRRASDGREVEKGIDVALALSIHSAARTGRFDVVVLVSADNDLLPVVHQLHPQRPGGPAIEVAAWQGVGGGKRMRVPTGVITHLLGHEVFSSAARDIVRDYGGRDKWLDARDRWHTSGRLPTPTFADRMDRGIVVDEHGLRGSLPGAARRDDPACRGQVQHIVFGSDGHVPCAPSVTQSVVVRYSSPSTKEADDQPRNARVFVRASTNTPEPAPPLTQPIRRLLAGALPRLRFIRRRHLAKAQSATAVAGQLE